MRRFRLLLALLTTIILVASLVPVAAAGEFDLNPNDLLKASVSIDGLRLDADAFIVNDRTVVPLRAIFERLGAVVEWDDATQTVTATKGSTVIKLTIGQTDASVNGKPTTLAVPAVLINSRTFVPLRFVSEALGAEVTWDDTNVTAVIKTNSSCALAPFQKHEGTIAKGGETWGRCGSPHVVSGTFMVEGADSPILTIEDGAVVQFEADAGLDVGKNAPGGLMVNGKASNPVVFTAASSGAQPGSWNGIHFYTQTLRNNSAITGARIEYAGGNGNWNGAIYLEGQDKLVTVKLVDVEIKNSQYSGLTMWNQAQLADGSKNLKITGTRSAEGEGGFPITTSIQGSNNLPAGTYTDNELNAVHLWSNADDDYITKNTTWKNIGIPYASSLTVRVEGNASPTLKIEPGVITLWAQDTGLLIGDGGPGALVADAKTKPDGNGDWTIDKTALDTGLSLAGSPVMTGPTCGLCGSNHAIVFGPWSDQNARGSWEGIRFKGKAADKSKLIGAVVAYGGKEGKFNGGIYVESSDTPIKLQLTNSLVTGSASAGLQFFGNNISFQPGSTGNYFTDNAIPVRLMPESIGSLEKGQTISGNDVDWVSVWSNSSGEAVTKTATWRNQGVPYYFEVSAEIGGSQRPVVTIEPGTKLMFAQDTGITVGTSDGLGSLVAVGAADKPITFTSEVSRAGTWQGLKYSDKAGDGNRLEYTTIEYAANAVRLDADLGAFIKNTTIRSSAENGIFRAYDLSSGTSFTQGLGNQFEGNAVDENVE